MSRETELKFALAANDVARFKKLALLRGKKVQHERLVSIYWDTPGFAVWHAGFGLRVRRAGKRQILSLKSAAAAQGGLHARDEWEHPLRARSAIYAQINNTAFCARVPEESGKQLAPCFVTDFRRTTWQLTLKDGTADLTLDQGEICAGDRCEPTLEVEIELSAGASSALFELARALLLEVPLRLESRSKAERGYRLAGLDVPIFHKAVMPELDADCSPAAAAHKVLAECLRHMDANSAGVLFARDAESLHQLRVAVRRTRAALNLFQDALAAEFAEPLIEQLRWLMREVGPARDWDVLITNTLEPVAAQYRNDKRMIALETAARRRAAAARARARRAVASQRYTKLVLTLGAWLARAPGRDVETDCGDRLLAYARRLLLQRRRRLIKRGHEIATLSDSERHEVRIAAKKLRYAAEFFSVIYPQKRVRIYLQSLEALQDVLGDLNDVAVASRMIEDLVGAKPAPDKKQAALLVAKELWRRKRALRADMSTAWKALEDAQPFWK